MILYNDTDKKQFVDFIINSSEPLYIISKSEYESLCQYRRDVFYFLENITDIFGFNLEPYYDKVKED